MGLNRKQMLGVYKTDTVPNEPNYNIIVGIVSKETGAASVGN